MIEELIGLARDMREASVRGEVLGLSEDEIAFYDALETYDSAVLGGETLRLIARERVRTVRAKVTIDWTARTCARSSNASCGSTATRPTSRRKPPRLCWNRPRCCRRNGRQREPRASASSYSVI